MFYNVQQWSDKICYNVGRCHSATFAEKSQMVGGKAMKENTVKSKIASEFISGTGEGYATAERALAFFDKMLDDKRHPEKVLEFLGKELAAKEKVRQEKADALPFNRFQSACVVFASALDAANKIVEEKGNSEKVIAEIFDRVFFIPEIYKAVNDLIEMPEVITRECLDAMNNASGGVVDCFGYSDILDYFLDEYEYELVDKISSASGTDKAKLERELKNKRFEMFPIYFNDLTTQTRRGFDRFLLNSPFGKRFFWMYKDAEDVEREIERELECRILCRCKYRMADFAPDENGRVNMPLRGGGGCQNWAGPEYEWLRDLIKRHLGIEDHAVNDKVVSVADNPVSEYAARYVLDYQESPEERFTFKRDDGEKFPIDLERSAHCQVKFLKRLITESGANDNGWVVMDNPDWLNHRNKLPKTIRPFFECVEKRNINGVQSFRITGKAQEWARGTAVKSSLQ